MKGGVALKLYCAAWAGGARTSVQDGKAGVFAGTSAKKTGAKEYFYEAERGMEVLSEGLRRSSLRSFSGSQLSPCSILPHLVSVVLNSFTLSLDRPFARYPYRTL
jgi:hypothetical protein